MALCKISEDFLPEEFYTYLLTPYLSTLRSKRSVLEYRRQILFICDYFYKKRGHHYCFEQLTEEDAKHYFLTYLTKECNEQRISPDTYRLRLSVCRNFALFLEERIPLLVSEGIYPDTFVYQSAFGKLYGLVKKPVVKQGRIASEAEIDAALSLAREHDRMLFCIFALSFRMYLPQKIILSLRKDHFTFFPEGPRMVGVVTYMEKGKQVYKRLPGDLVSILQEYVAAVADYLFVNQWGNPMTADNLSRAISRFNKACGCNVRLSQLRSRGIIDLIAHNAGSEDEISDYTGLSRQMLRGYGQALDKIANGCVADRGSYKILQITETEE